MSPTLNAELELGSDTVDLKEMVRTDNRATPTGAAEAPVPPEPAAPRAPTLGAMLKRRLDTYVELARRLTHDSHAPDLHAVGGEMDEVGLESFRSQLARLRDMLRGACAADVRGRVRSIELTF